MRTYTECSTASQSLIDTVEILTDADLRIVNQAGEETYTVAEAFAFERRIANEAFSDTRRRHAICIAFQCGAIGAVEAMNKLAADDLYGDPNYFLAAYAAGVAALSQNPDVAPEQPEAPRAISPDPELLSAVGSARLTNWRAA